jgi:O-6-methylguanine DNA methyltransferase
MPPLSFEGTPPGIHFFDTSLGPSGLAWTAAGIDALELPGEDLDHTRERLIARVTRASGQRPVLARSPESVRELAARIRRHLRGRLDPFADVPVDLTRASPYARRVYTALRQVPPGDVITYGELARRVGPPADETPAQAARAQAASLRTGNGRTAVRTGARAVGRIIGANPIPLIIPCHRVIAANGRIGGFSAPGGTDLKARLLFAEGVMLNLRLAPAITHLRRVDPALRRIIARVGPCPLRPEAAANAYASLVEAILYQQLALKAAATIASRVRALTPGPGYPSPSEMLALKPTQLRRAGLSRQKISYVKDLAARVADGRLRFSTLKRMDDEAAIAALSEVRGIGRWSAEMFLLFHLGRLDVLPVDDLGFRKGVQQTYALKQLPGQEQLKKLGERWRPYRSIATWYLWQSLRLASG